MLLSCALACVEAERAPVPSRLVGQRTLERFDGGLRPVFDRGARPAFAVSTPNGWSVTLVTSGGRYPLTTTSTSRPDGHWVLVDDPGPLPTGPGVLHLARSGVVTSTRAVVWRTAPEDLDPDAPDPWSRYWRAVEAGRTRFREGDWSEAEVRWRDAAEIAEAGGWTTLASARHLSLAYLAMESGEYARADAAAERAEQVLGAHATALERTRLHYTQASIAHRRFHFGEAARHLDVAIAEASRAGSRRDATFARTLLASNLCAVGRYAAAHEVITKTSTTALDPSLAVQVAMTRARVEIAGHEAGVLATDLEVLDGQLASIAGTPRQRDEAHLLRVAAALARGDLAVARAALAAVTTTLEDGGWKAWELRVNGAEIDLRQGRLGAARTKIEAAERALEQDAAHASYGCVVARQRAELELASGRASPRHVREHFVRALACYEQRGRFLRPNASRGALLWNVREIPNAIARIDAARGRPLDSLAILERYRGHVVARLAPAERPPPQWEAFEAARAKYVRLESRGCTRTADAARVACRARLERARSVVSASRDALWESLDRDPRAPRDRSWLVERLGRLRSDEAILSAVRSGEEPWLVHFATRGGVETTTSTAPVDALSDRIRRTRTLYLIVDEPDAVPEAEILLGRFSALSIAFGFDIATLTEGTSTSTRALVVVDPTSNLPHARREGRRVVDQVRGDALVGSDATLDLVREQWRRRSLFHFAGHATVEGDDPWTTRLELANGSIGVEDVFVEGPAIGVVVLNGCLTGRAERTNQVGLPAAFLATGSRAVLSTTAPIADADAAGFVARFYDAGGARCPIEAYAAAVRASMREGNTAHRAFRIWGRTSRSCARQNASSIGGTR